MPANANAGEIDSDVAVGGGIWIDASSCHRNGIAVGEEQNGHSTSRFDDGGGGGVETSLEGIGGGPFSSQNGKFNGENKVASKLTGPGAHSVLPGTEDDNCRRKRTKFHFLLLSNGKKGPAASVAAADEGTDDRRHEQQRPSENSAAHRYVSSQHVLETSPIEEPFPPQTQGEDARLDYGNRSASHRSYCRAERIRDLWRARRSGQENGGSFTPEEESIAHEGQPVSYDDSLTTSAVRHDARVSSGRNNDGSTAPHSSSAALLVSNDSCKDNTVMDRLRSSFTGRKGTIAIAAAFFAMGMSIGLGIGFGTRSDDASASTDPLTAPAPTSPSPTTAPTTLVVVDTVWQVDVNLTYLCGAGSNGELSLEQKTDVESAVVQYADENNQNVNFTAANVVSFRQSECCANNATCGDSTSSLDGESSFDIDVSGACTGSACAEPAFPPEDSINARVLRRNLQVGVNRSALVAIIQQFDTLDTVSYAEVFNVERATCLAGSDECDVDGTCCGVENCVCDTASDSLCQTNGCSLPGIDCCELETTSDVCDAFDVCSSSVPSLMPSASPTATPSIGGTMWEDSNLNGMQDQGEVEVDPDESRYNVWLYDCDTCQYVAEATYYIGSYRFDDQPPGRYYLRFDTNNDVWTGLTTTNRGDNETKDNDFFFVRSGEVIPGSTNCTIEPNDVYISGSTRCTALGAGEKDYSWGVGLVPWGASSPQPTTSPTVSSAPTVSSSPTQISSIGGFIWEDSNLNGVKDATEAELDAREYQFAVWLVNCDTCEYVTEAGYSFGRFQFDNVPPGNYYLRYMPLQSGQTWYYLTAANRGTNDTIDNDFALEFDEGVAISGSAGNCTEVGDGLTGSTACTALNPGENDESHGIGLVLNIG